MLRERAEMPFAVLADMQMDGTTGNALARELRAVCGVETRLVAMSGSAVAAEKTKDFDGFLLKPISVESLRAAVEGRDGTGEVEASGEEALNETTYASLAQSMPGKQLLKLYAMCLDDAERRIETMRAAVTDKDAGAYHRAAHAIKGGCGMVGRSGTDKAGGADGTKRDTSWWRGRATGTIPERDCAASAYSERASGIGYGSKLCWFQKL